MESDNKFSYNNYFCHLLNRYDASSKAAVPSPASSVNHREHHRNDVPCSVITQRYVS